MNNCYHSINDIPCPHSKLKGASAAVVNQQPKQFVFNSNEVNILGKSLQICRHFITKNQAQYQNPQDILKEINQSLKILKPKNSNTLKGASSNKNSNETKIQSLQNILKLFNLV